MKIVFQQNNLGKFKAASKQAVDRALEAIGLQAQEYAADRTPVDTGNLKGSITHELGDNCVYVGTNVEYAPYVEFIDRYHHATGQAHFLRDAVTKHNDEYKAIAERYLKDG